MGRKVGEEAVMFLARSRGPPAMRREGEGNTLKRPSVIMFH